MAKIVVGSIVRLKTGGPKMTVDAANSEGDHFTCMWFRKKRLCTSMIHIASLKLLKDGEEPAPKPMKRTTNGSHPATQV